MSFFTKNPPASSLAPLGEPPPGATSPYRQDHQPSSSGLSSLFLSSSPSSTVVAVNADGGGSPAPTLLGSSSSSSLFQHMMKRNRHKQQKQQQQQQQQQQQMESIDHDGSTIKKEEVGGEKIRIVNVNMVSSSSPSPVLSATGLQRVDGSRAAMGIAPSTSGVKAKTTVAIHTTRGVDSVEENPVHPPGCDDTTTTTTSIHIHYDRGEGDDAGARTTADAALFMNPHPPGAGKCAVASDGVPSCQDTEATVKCLAESFKVERTQCGKTVAILKKATENSPDKIPCVVIDYLVQLTYQPTMWCSAREMCNWVVAQLKDRMSTKQIWVIVKVYRVVHELLWRGSYCFAESLQNSSGGFFQYDFFKDAAELYASSNSSSGSCSPLLHDSICGAAGGGVDGSPKRTDVNAGLEDRQVVRQVQQDRDADVDTAVLLNEEHSPPPISVGKPSNELVTSMVRNMLSGDSSQGEDFHKLLPVELEMVKQGMKEKHQHAKEAGRETGTEKPLTPSSRQSSSRSSSTSSSSNSESKNDVTITTTTTQPDTGSKNTDQEKTTTSQPQNRSPVIMAIQTSASDTVPVKASPSTSASHPTTRKPPPPPLELPTGPHQSPASAVGGHNNAIAAASTEVHTPCLSRDDVERARDFTFNFMGYLEALCEFRVRHPGLQPHLMQSIISIAPSSFSGEAMPKEESQQKESCPSNGEDEGSCPSTSMFRLPQASREELHTLAIDTLELLKCTAAVDLSPLHALRSTMVIGIVHRRLQDITEFMHLIQMVTCETLCKLVLEFLEVASPRYLERCRRRSAGPAPHTGALDVLPNTRAPLDHPRRHGRQAGNPRSSPQLPHSSTHFQHPHPSQPAAPSPSTLVTAGERSGSSAARGSFSNLGKVNLSSDGRIPTQTTWSSTASAVGSPGGLSSAGGATPYTATLSGSATVIPAMISSSSSDTTTTTAAATTSATLPLSQAPHDLQNPNSSSSSSSDRQPAGTQLHTTSDNNNSNVHIQHAGMNNAHLKLDTPRRTPSSGVVPNNITPGSVVLSPRAHPTAANTSATLTRTTASTTVIMGKQSSSGFAAAGFGNGLPVHSRQLSLDSTQFSPASTGNGPFRVPSRQTSSVISATSTPRPHHTSGGTTPQPAAAPPPPYQPPHQPQLGSSSTSSNPHSHTLHHRHHTHRLSSYLRSLDASVSPRTSSYISPLPPTPSERRLQYNATAQELLAEWYHLLYQLQRTMTLLRSLAATVTAHTGLEISATRLGLLEVDSEVLSHLKCFLHGIPPPSPASSDVVTAAAGTSPSSNSKPTTSTHHTSKCLGCTVWERAASMFSCAATGSCPVVESPSMTAVQPHSPVLPSSLNGSPIPRSTVDTFMTTTTTTTTTVTQTPLGDEETAEVAATDTAAAAEPPLQSHAAMTAGAKASAAADHNASPLLQDMEFFKQLWAQQVNMVLAFFTASSSSTITSHKMSSDSVARHGQQHYQLATMKLIDLLRVLSEASAEEEDEQEKEGYEGEGLVDDDDAEILPDHHKRERSFADDHNDDDEDPSGTQGAGGYSSAASNSMVLDSAPMKDGMISAGGLTTMATFQPDSHHGIMLSGPTAGHTKHTTGVDGKPTTTTTTSITEDQEEEVQVDHNSNSFSSPLHTSLPSVHSQLLFQPTIMTNHSSHSASNTLTPFQGAGSTTGGYHLQSSSSSPPQPQSHLHPSHPLSARRPPSTPHSSRGQSTHLFPSSSLTAATHLAPSSSHRHSGQGGSLHHLPPPHSHRLSSSMTGMPPSVSPTDVLESLALAVEEDKLLDYDLIPSFVPVVGSDSDSDSGSSDPSSKDEPFSQTMRRTENEEGLEAMEAGKTPPPQPQEDDDDVQDTQPPVNAPPMVARETPSPPTLLEHEHPAGEQDGDEERDPASPRHHTHTITAARASSLSLVEPESNDLHPKGGKDHHKSAHASRNSNHHHHNKNNSSSPLITPSNSTLTAVGPLDPLSVTNTSGGLRKPSPLLSHTTDDGDADFLLSKQEEENHSTIMLFRQDGSFYSLVDTILNHERDNEEVDESVRQLLEEDDVVVVCNEKCSCNDKVNLADRFQVLHDLPLGQGTFGSVFRAWDSQAGCYLAAKEVPLKLMSSGSGGVGGGMGAMPGAMPGLGGGFIAARALDQPAGSPRVSEALREFTVLTSLDHPRIVKVVAFMVRGKVGCIFMEWMPAGSLLEVVRHRQQQYQHYKKTHPPPPPPQQLQQQQEQSFSAGSLSASRSSFGSSQNNLLQLGSPLSGGEHHHGLVVLGLEERFVQRYARDTLEGLAYLHSRRVLHRDIKPANLLLAADGSVKLTDFGTSHVFGDDVGDGDGLNATLETSSIMGTIAYLAPEAVKGVYSPASDVWALGCTVLELLTCVPPWCDLETHHHPGNIPLLFKIGNLDNERNLERPHTALLNTPQGELLSPELKDFLNIIFVTDRHARPSAQALLDHPFMKVDFHDKKKSRCNA